MVLFGEYVMHAVFGVLGLWLSIIDVRWHRLPNLGTGLLSVLMGSVGLGVVVVGEAEPSRLVTAVLTSVLSAGFFGLLAALPPQPLGWGDVKLQVGLGFYLGWLHPALAVGQVFGAFFLGGVVALWQIVRTKMSASDHLAFGPYMIAGGAVMVWLGKSVEII
jgi:leader peptidase (prepilin peptidase)/N-methyltransferase